MLILQKVHENKAIRIDNSTGFTLEIILDSTHLINALITDEKLILFDENSRAI